MKLSNRELRQALVAEREALTALVSRVSDDELDNPSLCEGWSNRNVLSHILSFELNSMDALKLLLRLASLDDITEVQSRRYTDRTQEEYLHLLQRGLNRTLLVLRLCPSSLLNYKVLPVPNGRLSMGQLVGDIIMDRAIHRLDIAAPLGLGNRLTDEVVMNVAIKFILASIDLLEPKTPITYHGSWVELRLTGLCEATYYWCIGAGHVVAESPNENVALTAQVDTNDFLFSVSVRETLRQSSPQLTGDIQLGELLLQSFNANALWEV